MDKGGQKTGLQRGDRTRFPYEPRVIGGKLVMPAELQRIHRIILDAAEVEIISDEMRAVVESLWPELGHKLPHKHSYRDAPQAPPDRPRLRDRQGPTGLHRLLR